MPELIAKALDLPWDPMGRVSVFEQRYGFDEVLKATLTSQVGKQKAQQLFKFTDAGPGAFGERTHLHSSAQDHAEWRFYSNDRLAADKLSPPPVMEVLEDR